MTYEDVQDKSVKERLYDKTVEGMEYALKNSPADIPEKFIALISKFVEAKWDEIFEMYNTYFPGADLEKILDMMDTPEYKKHLDFNIVYQAWLNKELMEFFMEHEDEVDAILEEEEKEKKAAFKEAASRRFDELKDRENNADNDSFWAVDPTDK